MVEKYKFIIPRISQGELTFAVITFAYPFRPWTVDQFLELLRIVLTDWVLQTEEGMDLWESSSHDLNVGDLGTHGISNWVHDRLREHYHVTNLKVECQCCPDVGGGDWHYDSILVESGRIVEAEDKDALPTE